eukprot:s2760_g7.t1
MPGRPAGTVETKFSEEEKQRIVESVDSTKVSSVIATKGLTDIADLFGKAGEKDATITRVQLEENAYIMQPLFHASPEQLKKMQRDKDAEAFASFQVTHEDAAGTAAPEKRAVEENGEEPKDSKKPIEDVRDSVKGVPVPMEGLPPRQKALKAEKKAEAKSKAPKAESTQQYVMKPHKRKDKPTAFAIHNRSTNKQIGQLVETVVEKADEKVDQLVRDLNSGKITEADVLACLSKLKTGNQSS